MKKSLSWFLEILCDHVNQGSLHFIYPGLKLGIMKMALKIPFPNVLLEDSTKFKSADDLRALFQSNGIDLSRPLTSTCFVGVTACILALGAFVVGKEDVAVFDGSWDEYSQRGPEDSMTIYEEKAKPWRQYPCMIYRHPRQASIMMAVSCTFLQKVRILKIHDSIL